MADNKIDAPRETPVEPYRHKEKEKAKEKSEFERALEQNQQKQAQTSVQKLNIGELGEYVSREGRRQDEREQEKERERSKDKNRDGDQQQGERKRDGAQADQRVVAKGSTKQNRDGSHSGGEGRGQGFQGELRKRQAEALDKLASGKEGPISLANRFEQQLKASLQDATKSDKLSQSIMNQIVQTVKFGLNQAGEKEIQLRFQEQVFRGLKMRVSKKDGKVVVQFIANDRKTRETFLREQPKLLAELKKKGIDIEELTVV